MSPMLQPAIAPIDPALEACLGPPPLYAGETGNEYNILWDRLRRAVRPTDAVEELAVWNLLLRYCDLRRYQCAKAKLLASSRASGLWRLLEFAVPDRSSRTILLSRWVQGEQAAKDEVLHLLRQSGSDETHIDAQTFLALIGPMETLDRMIMQAERRVDDILRAIDRRRDGFARRLRDGLAEVEDAEVIVDQPVNGADRDDDILG